VIATDVGGNSEIIDNGVNGLLLKNNNLDVLGKALRMLLLDWQARRKYGERGYETVITRFDFRDRVSKEESFYKGLIK
jgi:glycosyltransferase involved in cell wall biosynthesis